MNFNFTVFPFDSQESPPISPTSIMSGPYIPISECISGPRLNDTSSLNSMTGQVIDSYDVARRLVPSPPRSPTTDAESIITDDESLPSLPNVNWDTFPSAGTFKFNNFIIFELLLLISLTNFCLVSRRFETRF